MNKTEAKKFVKATDLVPLRTPKNDPDYGRPRIGAGNSKAVPLSVQAAQLRRFADLDPETMARLGYLRGMSDSPDMAGKVISGAGYTAVLAPAVVGMMSTGGKRSERRPIEVRNIRVTNVPDAIATLSHRKISGASSILTSPNATFSTIGTGYGYSSVPGSVHLMLTPTATTPDRNTGVVTFLGDGYTASSKAFYKKVGDYEHGLSLSQEEPSLGLFTKAYYDKELMKRGVPTRDNGKMFFSKVPDYENIPTSVKTAAFKDARNAWLRDYAEKKGAQAPGLVPTRFGYPVGRPDLMEKDIQWFRNAGHLVLDSASAVSDPSARDRLSYMLGHPYSTSYVENKMYMPLDIPEAIGGIAMSHDVPTRLADVIRGRAQYFGIPVRTFDKRPPQSRSFPELEPVIKDMAPVTSLDAKGGSTTHSATKAGDAGGASSTGVPSGHNPALDGYGGPRVVVNPSTFRNEKDGLCVAMNEAFRIIMEMNGFDPVSEPTERQRKFFSDTAYNDDELMLRRTILARICTFDTSVKDPTDEQLQEAVEFLDTVMEIGAPQNEWEQQAVKRIRDTIERTVGQPRAEEPPEET